MTSPQLDETHDPALRSWVPGADGHPEFPIQNLPLAVFSPVGGAPRAGVAIGDRILDLAAVAATGALAGAPGPLLASLRAATLNALFERPATERRWLRRRLSALLETDAPRLDEALLHDAADCALHLPARIGDYTDFYAGIHHATNVGRLFRPDAPLLPNYKHVPIGYHGRASSVRASGGGVTRPWGQTKAADADAPRFAPTERLDYEAEFGVWIGAGNPLGRPVTLAQAGDHIAGFCLLNDWSARDMQAWEYQPLGPFLAKSFHTTVSPWVVTPEALAPFRIAQAERPAGDPRPLPHLWDEADQAHGALAVTVQVHIATADMRAKGLAPFRLSAAALSDLYWTVGQLVTHHTSNGCDLHAGDLFGSGTVSGSDPSGYGSLLELTAGGRRPLALPSGETRTFLQDGDEISLTARAEREGFVALGFGPCRGVVRQAADLAA